MILNTPFQGKGFTTFILKPSISY